MAYFMFVFPLIIKANAGMPESLLLSVGAVTGGSCAIPVKICEKRSPTVRRSLHRRPGAPEEFMVSDCVVLNREVKVNQGSSARRTSWRQRSPAREAM